MVGNCSEVHEQALVSCGAIHRERRVFLKQEIGRMVLFFADQPSLLAPNIQVRLNCIFLKVFLSFMILTMIGRMVYINLHICVYINLIDPKYNQTVSCSMQSLLI